MLSRRVDLPLCIGSTSLLKYVRIFYKVDQLHQPLRRKMKRTDVGIEVVRCRVTENCVASLRKIVPHSSSSLTTVWKLLRYVLKFKFYRITSVQPLKDTHKQMMSSQEGLISSDKRTVLISTRLTYTFGLLPKK